MHGFLLFTSKEPITFFEMLDQLKPYNSCEEEFYVWRPFTEGELTHYKKQFENYKMSYSDGHGPFIETTMKEYYKTFEQYLDFVGTHNDETKEWGWYHNPKGKFNWIIIGGRWAPLPLKAEQPEGEEQESYYALKKDIDIEAIIRYNEAYQRFIDMKGAPCETTEEKVDEIAKELCDKPQEQALSPFIPPDAIFKNGEWLETCINEASYVDTWKSVWKLIDDDDYVVVMDYHC